MNNWEIVKQKIELNKREKFDYKLYLDMSLTKYITEKRGNMKPEELVIHINDLLARNGITERKRFEKVKHSVYARLSEQDAFLNRLRGL